MNAHLPHDLPLRPDETDGFVKTASWYDGQDYWAGYAMGSLGDPDPHNVNYATWRGWRDGAARCGYLERIEVFRNRA